MKKLYDVLIGGLIIWLFVHTVFAVFMLILVFTIGPAEHTGQSVMFAWLWLLLPSGVFLADISYFLWHSRGIKVLDGKPFSRPKAYLGLGLRWKLMRNTLSNIKEDIRRIREALEKAEAGGWFPPYAITKIKKEAREGRFAKAKEMILQEIKWANKEVRKLVELDHAAESLVERGDDNHCAGLVTDSLRVGGILEAKKTLIRCKNLLSRARELGVEREVAGFLEEKDPTSAEQLLESQQGLQRRRQLISDYKKKVAELRPHERAALQEKFEKLTSSVDGSDRTFRKALYALNKALEDLA